MRRKNLKSSIDLTFLGTMFMTAVTSIFMSVQTITTAGYENLKNTSIYKNIEQKQADAWNKVNRNKDTNTIGAESTYNENNLKVTSYKEGFINDKISNYIKSSKKIFNIPMQEIKITLHDGYATVNAVSSETKLVNAKLKVSENKKNLIIYEVEVVGFGNLENATKTTLENFINLNKDFLSRYFDDNIEIIEIKQGEVVMYFTLAE